jgi:hypothetical protein
VVSKYRGRSVQEYTVEGLRQIEEEGLRRQSAMKTNADDEAYVLLVRQKIRSCFGPFPERTPLTPRVVGVVERDQHSIEKVILESRPGFLVTANLYLPKGRKFPLPGVVGTCGHAADGKADAFYQSFAQGLARMGGPLRRAVSEALQLPVRAGIPGFRILRFPCRAER